MFVSAAYKPPREGNWVIGVVLAALTAGLFFTGSVLKWDQESLEALEHNIEVGKLLGKFGFWFAPTFGGIPLLTRLYVVHISVLPALFTLAVAVHLLLVKRLKMAPSPFRKGPEPEPTRPFTHHLGELTALGLVLIGVLTVLAVLLPQGTDRRQWRAWRSPSRRGRCCGSTRSRTGWGCRHPVGHPGHLRGPAVGAGAGPLPRAGPRPAAADHDRRCPGGGCDHCMTIFAAVQPVASHIEM